VQKNIKKIKITNKKRLIPSSSTIEFFTGSLCCIKCVQALKNPNPLSVIEGWMCLLLLRCFRIGSGVDYLCKSTLD